MLNHSSYKDIDNKNIKKALYISTLCTSGTEQMSIDLSLLNKTIVSKDILFTFRLYKWEGNWLSIGYHQKKIPEHWIELSKRGLFKIVKRPSGGGAVLHSGGITYALTFKKTLYKKLSYQFINNWLIESFSNLGIKLIYGNIKKASIKDNCFSTSFTSDLIDKKGFKRVGSAQFWKKGSFLQHGEIQLSPSSSLWADIFREEAPPPLKLTMHTGQLIEYLKNSFIKNNSNSAIENIFVDFGELDRKTL